MKTLSILNRKAVLSWFYLLIAVGLVLITVIPASRTADLFYSQVHIYVNGNGGAYRYGLGWPSFLLWVMAVVYLVHFIYGAFYLPGRYREILRCGYTGDDTVADLSQGRGLIAMALVWIIIYFLNGDQFSSNAPLWWTLSAVWLVFNLCLSFATETGSLFGKSSVKLDQYAIAPWLYSKEPKNKCDYITIYFTYPVADGEEKRKKLIAIGYANSLLRAHEEESDVDAAADQLTRTVMAEAHPR